MDRSSPAPSPACPGSDAAAPTGTAPSPDVSAMLAAASRGDRPALVALEHHARKAMHGAAVRVLGPRGDEAADAVQDAWCQVLTRPQALATVRPGTERAWLAGVARHTALRRLGRRQAWDHRTVHEPEGLAGLAETAPEPSPYSPEETAAVVDVFTRMPTVVKVLLTLALVEQMPCPEIARTLGIPRSTARDRLRAELTRLRARAWRARRAAKGP